VRKISPPPGFDPQTVQPVASSQKVLYKNVKVLKRLKILCLGLLSEREGSAILIGVEIIGLKFGIFWRDTLDQGRFVLSIKPCISFARIRRKVNKLVTNPSCDLRF
jgi:hypothetical protein